MNHPITITLPLYVWAILLLALIINWIVSIKSLWQDIKNACRAIRRTVNKLLRRLADSTEESSDAR